MRVAVRFSAVPHAEEHYFDFLVERVGIGEQAVIRRFEIGDASGSTAERAHCGKSVRDGSQDDLVRYWKAPIDKAGHVRDAHGLGMVR